MKTVTPFKPARIRPFGRSTSVDHSGAVPATASADGLMSSADKFRLDAMTGGNISSAHETELSLFMTSWKIVSGSLMPRDATGTHGATATINIGSADHMILDMFEKT